MASSIGVGVVGTGFMGAAHAQSFLAVSHIFEPALTPRLVVVADINLPAAQGAARRYGFGRATGDWKDLVADPAVEAVIVAGPPGQRRWARATRTTSVAPNARRSTAA